MGINQDVQSFYQTQIALNESKKILNIIEYMETVNFQIDQFMFSKFWNIISKNTCTYIGASVLEWLGYGWIKQEVGEYNLGY